MIEKPGSDFLESQRQENKIRFKDGFFYNVLTFNLPFAKVTGNLENSFMTVDQQPRRISEKQLYDLNGEERVLFSIFPRAEGALYRRIGKEAREADANFIKRQAEAEKIAEEIENGQDLPESGSMDQEAQGLYKDVRVVVARHPATGHRLNAFTLIGTHR